MKLYWNFSVNVWQTILNISSIEIWLSVIEMNSGLCIFGIILWNLTVKMSSNLRMFGESLENYNLGQFWSKTKTFINKTPNIPHSFYFCSWYNNKLIDDNIKHRRFYPIAPNVINHIHQENFCKPCNCGYNGLFRI